METLSNSDNERKKIWPINWQTNKTTKVVFVSAVTVLLLCIATLFILFPHGDGSGAAMWVMTPFVIVFGFLFLIHFVFSLRIKKDIVDKIFFIISAIFLPFILVPMIQSSFLAALFGFAIIFHPQQETPLLQPVVEVNQDKLRKNCCKQCDETFDYRAIDETSKLKTHCLEYNNEEFVSRNRYSLSNECTAFFSKNDLTREDCQTSDSSNASSQKQIDDNNPPDYDQAINIYSNGNVPKQEDDEDEKISSIYGTKGTGWTFQEKKNVRCKITDAYDCEKITIKLKDGSSADVIFKVYNKDLCQKTSNKSDVEWAYCKN